MMYDIYYKYIYKLHCTDIQITCIKTLHIINLGVWTFDTNDVTTQICYWL